MRQLRPPCLHGVIIPRRSLNSEQGGLHIWRASRKVSELLKHMAFEFDQIRLFAIIEAKL